MIEFNDQLSTDGMHVPRGSKNQVSGDSRIRKARLNARPRGPQSRFIVRPADQSVFQDDWDLDDNFGDYGLSLTTSEMADVESLGRVTFWHPTGAQWCDDPTTFYILPRNAEERAYLRELYYASGAKRTTRSQRTRKGRLRRVNGAPVVPVVPVVAERTRPEREQWTANRPGYVSKRLRRKANRSARKSEEITLALLDGLMPVPSRPLPVCTSCGKQFSFDRAILVVELDYQEAGNCPDCCTALVKSSAA